MFDNPYINGDTLCNYLQSMKKIPILSPLLNIIHTDMDKDQQQSKVIKSADEEVSSIVNIFVENYALVVKVLLMV